MLYSLLGLSDSWRSGENPKVGSRSPCLTEISEKFASLYRFLIQVCGFCPEGENGGYVEARAACMRQPLLLLPIVAGTVTTTRKTLQETPHRRLSSLSGEFLRNLETCIVLFLVAFDVGLETVVDVPHFVSNIYSGCLDLVILLLSYEVLQNCCLSQKRESMWELESANKTCQKQIHS